MEDIKKNKLFIRFLKENNCYKEFIRNYHNEKMSYYFWRQNKDKKNNITFIKIQFSKELFTHFISSHFNIIDTFDHAKTKEGIIFWENIRKKWLVIKNNTISNDRN